MAKVDIDKIAKKLGATRRGTVGARSGYFGAMELRPRCSGAFRCRRRVAELQTLRSRFSGRSRCRSRPTSASS